MDTAASGAFVTPFLGRQRELAELDAALESASAGAGRLIMLVGEPGIGKTRTALQFADTARASGAQVLWGRCHEEPGTPPYWPWIHAIRSYLDGEDPAAVRKALGASAGDIATIVPEVSAHSTSPEPHLSPSDPSQARFRLFDSVSGFLKRAAACQPLVLILDNLHWADSPSLRLLEFIAPELRHSALLVLGTYRDVELSRRHPLVETLGRLAAEPSLSRIRLHGLACEDIARLIEIRGTEPGLHRLAHCIHGQTEGNPFFVTEIVRDLLESGHGTIAPGDPGGDLPQAIRIPEGVRDVIGKRLNRLSPACNDLLAAASVLGRSFDFMELRRLVDDAVFDTLEEAIGARIVEESLNQPGRFQFAHALMRETIYDEISAPRRMRLHARSAEVIEALHGDTHDEQLARLVHHYYEASPRGGAQKAIACAMEAGARANAMLAYEAAAAYFGKALDCLELEDQPDRSRECSLLLAIGEAQRKAGNVERAMDAYEAAGRLAEQAESAEMFTEAALGFETARWRCALPAESSAARLEQALSMLPPADSSLRARALGSLARALSYTAAADRAVDVAQSSVHMARRLGDPPVLCLALGDAWLALRRRLDMAPRRLAYGREQLDLAERMQDKERAADAASLLRVDLLECGELAELDAIIARYAALAQELREPHHLYQLAFVHAMRALLDGRFDEVADRAREALDNGSRLQAANADGVFSMQMFTLRREQGRLNETEPLIRAFVERQPSAATWVPGLALIYTELGRREDAAALFARLAADDFAAIASDDLWLTSIAYLAEACAALPECSHAETLYQFLLPYSGRNVVFGPAVVCYGPADRYLGLLAGKQHRRQEAAAHFEAALELCTKMASRPLLARTQTDYAATLMETGLREDLEHARPLLEAAADTARALGMASLSERIVELRGGSRRDAGRHPDELTGRELEVLRLITEGKSNRRIAATLFISVPTVASHVRNILGKTGTGNRTEAAAWARTHGLLH